MSKGRIVETRQAYTPGPWVIAEEVQGRIGRMQPCILGQGSELAVVSVRADDREEDANARLIAAAPELLAALKALIAEPDLKPWSEEWDQAHSAVAKAEGRS